MANRDSVARDLAAHRDELEPRYVVPFPSVQAMDELSNKVGFVQACAALGLHPPRQVEVTGADLADGDPQIGIPFSSMGVDIVTAAAFIGATTFVLSAIGVWVGNIFGAKYKSIAELAGGVILVLLGTQILLEHLGIL